MSKEPKFGGRNYEQLMENVLRSRHEGKGYPDIWLMSEEVFKAIEEKQKNDNPDYVVGKFRFIFGIPFEAHPDDEAVTKRAEELQREGKFKQIGIIADSIKRFDKRTEQA